MKINIEIPDALLNAARKLTEREHTTLCNLIEIALREVLARRQQQHSFKLRKASCAGQGLQRDARGASWERLREVIYEGHGG